MLAEAGTPRAIRLSPKRWSDARRSADRSDRGRASRNVPLREIDLEPGHRRIDPAAALLCDHAAEDPRRLRSNPIRPQRELSSCRKRLEAVVETIRVAFLDGPARGERETLPDPPPSVLDRHVLLNPTAGYPLGEGEPYVDADWAEHRYRLAAVGWYRLEDGVAMYQHVGPVNDLD